MEGWAIFGLSRAATAPFETGTPLRESQLVIGWMAVGGSWWVMSERRPTAEMAACCAERHTLCGRHDRQGKLICL